MSAHDVYKPIEKDVRLAFRNELIKRSSEMNIKQRYWLIENETWNAILDELDTPVPLLTVLLLFNNGLEYLKAAENI